MRFSVRWPVVLAVFSMVALVPVAAPAQAMSAMTMSQGNPFAVKISGYSPITVQYQYAGDMTGTGESTANRDTMAHRQTVTAKFFGHTGTDSTWSMTTATYLWNADLGKKTGTKSVNPIPAMAKAYNDLDADSKTRFHSNMQQMAQYVTRALPGVPLTGTTKETRTIAGETCEQTNWGSFSFCTMKSTPVMLYSSGSFLCVNYEQTATSVAHSTDAALLKVPDGIKWSETLDSVKADSMARIWVNQLASKELADSLAKAQKEYETEQASHPASDTSQAHMTPEQQKKMCDALKNYSLSQALNDAWKSFLKETAKEAGRSAADQLVHRLIKPPLQ